MAEFDPYLKWLGIRESARPVNHYRLLGLDLFESDPEVITIAADRQMAHVRTYQSGPNGHISQQILNELSRARRCLLVADKKEAYDNQLRSQLAASQAEAVQSITPNIQSTPDENDVAFGGFGEDVGETGFKKPSGDFQIKKDPNAKSKAQKRQRKQLMFTLLGWLTSALAAVGVSAWIIGSGMLGNVTGGGDSDPDPRNPTKVAKNDNTSKKSDPKSTKSTNNNAAATNSTDNGQKTNPGTAPKIANNPSNVFGNPGAVSNPNNSPSSTDGNPANNSSPSSNASNNSVSNPATSNAAANLTPTPTRSGKGWSPSSFKVPDDPSIAPLFPKIKELVSEDKLIHLEDVNLFRIPTGDAKHRSVPTASLLLGLKIAFAKDLTISSIQPMFTTQSKAFEGMNSGQPTDRTVLLLAKPGYVIGEIHKSILNPINCVRVRYMKQTPSGVDPNDSYLSEWVGMEKGPIGRIENTNGLPPVGIETFTNNEGVLSHFYVVYADENATPGSLVSAAAPNAQPMDRINGIGPITNKLLHDAGVLTYEQLGKMTPEEVRKAMGSGIGPQTDDDFKSWIAQAGQLAASTSSGSDPSFFNNTNPANNPTNVAPLNAPPMNNNANTAAPVAKLKIPGNKERKAAADDLTALYPEIRNTNTTYEYQRLAEKLIRDAKDPNGDPDIKYEMLMAAKKWGEELGNARISIEALRLLNESFEIKYWKDAEASFKEIARNASSTREKQYLKSELDNLIREAITGESFDAAKDLLSFASELATKSKDKVAREAYQDERKNIVELKRIADDAADAFKILKDDRTDKPANKTYGDYLFLVQGQVKEACECWVNSNDADLSKLAELELSHSAFKGDDLLKLAKEWRKLGDAETKLRKRRYLERAIELFESAERRLSGLDKRESSNAIREIKEELAK